MKRLLLLAAFLPLTANAIDFEAAIGAAHYTPRGNMMWYQEGLPYDLKLTVPAIQLGVAGNVIEHLDWHADYVYLGRVSSDAIATPDDKNYDPVAKACRGECIARSRFRGHGDVHGVKLSLEPNFTWRGFRFGVEAGVFVYRPSWSEVVDNWVPYAGAEPRTIQAPGNPTWTAGPMLGASVGRGPVDLSYQWFQTKSNAGQLHTLYKSTHVVQVRYRW